MKKFFSDLVSPGFIALMALAMLKGKGILLL
ncbi:hypothetical protein METP3_02278 [Methanosarcinales archaeon]|nr:hypothetical protein METP3_02278 [Methanosarcinales archaeon]